MAQLHADPFLPGRHFSWARGHGPVHESTDRSWVNRTAIIELSLELSGTEESINLSHVSSNNGPIKLIQTEEKKNH